MDATQNAETNMMNDKTKDCASTNRQNPWVPITELTACPFQTLHDYDHDHMTQVYE